MLSKNSFKNSGWLWAAVGWMLMAVPLLLADLNTGEAASKPSTNAEIALYQGPDRMKIIIDRAKQEGQVTFYTSHTWFATVVKEFEKKYPFIKVLIWRGDTPSVVTKTTEEYSSKHFLADVVETTLAGVASLHRNGIFQEYYSPETAKYADAVMLKGKTGIYYMAEREIYIGLGFNTKLIPVDDAPKTYKDLLDPKWKGRMSIPGTDTGVRFIGNALNVMGSEYLEKLSRQDVRVQNLSGAALANMIVSGEVALSPSIFDSNIFVAKQKKAPVEWRPLEPVIAQQGYAGMTTMAPHPGAALLLLDYLHSKEGQQVIIKGGLNSPREDMFAKQSFKKAYLDAQYSPEEFVKKYDQWQQLMRRLFIMKL